MSKRQYEQKGDIAFPVLTGLEKALLVSIRNYLCKSEDRELSTKEAMKVARVFDILGVARPKVRGRAERKRA